MVYGRYNELVHGGYLDNYGLFSTGLLIYLDNYGVIQPTYSHHVWGPHPAVSIDHYKP